MAVDVTADKLQKLVESPPSKTIEEVESEAKIIDSTETVEETTETKAEESVENGEDKAKAPAEKIEGVPMDKDGNRPSDKASIDFDKLKEQLTEEDFQQVEKRFRELYRQVKAQDRYLDTFHQDFDARIKEITEQDLAKSKSIEDLASVVTQLSTKDATAQQQMQLQTLQKAKAQAYQDMDFDKVAELDIQIMQTLSQPQKVELPKIELPKAEEKNEEETTGELPSLTPREQAYVLEWTNEADANGQLIRPWAQPGHPLYSYALGQTDAMLKHPQLKGADLQTVLQTVDHVMLAQMQGEQQQETTQTETKAETKAKEPPEVLTADQNLRTKKTEDKTYLSREQESVAERLFSKLSPKEAHKKYLNSLLKIQKAQKT
jgi:hypothetical protein